MRDRRFDEVRRALTEALEAHPGDLLLLGGMIQLSTFERNLDEGLAYARRALAIDVGNKWTARYVMDLFAACGQREIPDRREGALTKASAGDTDGACLLLEVDGWLAKDQPGYDVIRLLFDRLRDEISATAPNEARKP